MFKNDKTNGIVVSICLFVIGLCIFIWADKVINFVSLALGAILIAHCVVIGIKYFSDKQKDTGTILSMVLSLTIGIILIMRPSIISEMVSVIVGVYILISSISSLNITLSNKKSKKYHLNLILSIIGIILGVLCILGKILIPDLILRYLGLMLMIYSVIDIIGIQEIKFIKK